MVCTYVPVLEGGNELPSISEQLSSLLWYIQLPQLSRHSISSTPALLGKVTPSSASPGLKRRVGCRPRHGRRRRPSRHPDSRALVEVSTAPLVSNPATCHSICMLAPQVSEPYAQHHLTVQSLSRARGNGVLLGGLRWRTTPTSKRCSILPGSSFPQSRTRPALSNEISSFGRCIPPCCWCGVGPASAVVSTGNDTRQHIKMGHTLSRISQWTCV